MIETLIPPPTVAVEAYEDLLGEEIFPEEACALGGAIDQRRREFITGRACARTALAQLGFPRVAIPRGDRGAPIWPAGTVGSITHCAGYRACVVARSTDIAAVGIDAEPHAPLPSGVLAAIVATDEEWKWATRPASVCRDRLLFSAKEAAFKAWYPLTQRWLGFEEVELSAISDAGTFGVRFLVPEPNANSGRLNAFEGRWTWTPGLILTAVVVRHRSTAATSRLTWRS